MRALVPRTGGRAVLARAALCLLVVGAPVAAAGPPLSASSRTGIAAAALDVQVDTATLEEVDDYLMRSLEEHSWPGLAAALVADGEVLWSAGYGSTGRSGVPVTPQTPFLLASVSKSLTSVAVMRLVEAGSLDLGDAVSDYLPELAPGGEDVTVGDLMFHRTGLDTITGVEAMRGPPATSLTANVSRFEPLLRADAGFEYSNANYDALALIVERASGVPFGDYLRSEVFSPLEMTAATTEPSAARAAGLAEGHYHWLFAGFRPHTPPLPEGAVGSYRMFASAEDIAHSLLMQVDDGRFEGLQILQPGSLSVLHTGEPIGPGDEAAYGGGLWVHPAGSAWMTGASAAYPFLEHDGSALAYRSYIWLMPELGLGLALLANANDWSDEWRLPQVGFNVRQILLDEEVTPVETRSPPLQRWGKHLFAVVAVLQFVLTLAAVGPVERAWRGRAADRRGRVTLLATAAVSLFTGYVLVRLIPTVAAAPLRIVAQAPDARILIAVLLAGLIGAAVLGVAYVVGRHRGRAPQTEPSQVRG